MMTAGGSDGAGGSAAGWYADPGGAQLLRYWDGTRWTEHTAPHGASAAGRPGTPQRGGSNRGLWVVLALAIGIPVLLVAVGVIAAVAIPVFFSQREKAADASAKADVATLGKEVAAWYVDNTGAPPGIATQGGRYYVDGADVGPISQNVELRGMAGVGQNDWCVWVTNPEGDLKDFEYSAERGLDQGSC